MACGMSTRWHSTHGTRLAFSLSWRAYTAGGITHVFHRPGFEWDLGVHYVGQVHQRDSRTAALFDHLTEGR